MGFQIAAWRVQKGGWIALALFMLAALLGGFSQGPLSRTEAISQDGSLRVEYERLMRNGASDDMRIEVRSASADGELHVHLGEAFVAAFTIESLAPQPLRMSLGRGGITLVYATPGDLPARIHLMIRPHRVGLVASAIRLGQSLVEFRQFVYP